MFQTKETIKDILACFGYRTDKHYVVFESDDWGAIRIPSKSVLNSFRKKFPEYSLDHYQLYDGLERASDVEELSELLKGYSTLFFSSSPVFTLNFATANPDFKRCTSEKCIHFEYETIDKTYYSYGEGSSILDYIRCGRDETALHPQLHGREHLNATVWLNNAAKDSAVDFSKSFGMVGVDNVRYNGIDALNGTNYLIDKSTYLADSARIFNSLFGFVSKSFIPPCYVSDTSCEQLAMNLGVNTIQSSTTRNVPKANNRLVVYPNVFGKTSTKGQCRLIRNVQFEPSKSFYQGEQSDDCVDRAFAEIEMAFSRRQPAVVCTHRVNYTSRVDQAHRIFSLTALKKLLDRLSIKYPDCIFITSDQLGELILSEGNLNR